MINTVAKIELGLAAAAFVMAVGVAVAFDDPGGFVLLCGVAMAVLLAGLALTGSGFSDRAIRAGAAADDPIQMVSVGRSGVPKSSPWPLAGAFALGLVALGLAFGSYLVVIGVVCGLLVSAGWLSQAWREDPSFTHREGARISSRLLSPVGLPVMAVGLIAVIVVSISRVLLALPRVGSIVVAFGLAVALLIAFFALSTRPNLPRNSLVFLASLSVVALVGAGSVGAAKGYRTFDHIETGAGPVDVVARNTAFNLKTITVVAGASTTIVFKNDDRIYHNIAVYSSTGTPYWDGEPIKGVKKLSYVHTFDMPPGTYTFRCDFHPTSMVGTFVVSAAATSGTTP
jgi:plastocyanin